MLFVTLVEVNTCVLTWVTWNDLERQNKPHYVLYMAPHSLIYTVHRSEYMALALRYISLQRGDSAQGQRSTEEWERQCNRAAVPSLNGPQPCSEEAQLTACNRPAIHLQQHWQAIWTHTPCCLSCSTIHDVFLVWSVFSVNMRLLLVALQWW